MDHKICPFLSTPETEVNCLLHDCAMWRDFSYGQGKEFKGCLFHGLADDLTNLRYGSDEK